MCRRYAQAAFVGGLLAFGLASCASAPDPEPEEVSIFANGLKRDYAYAFAADTRRPIDDYARYAAPDLRKLLAFVAPQPGMELVELGAEQGFYTELLASLVGNEGAIRAYNSQDLHLEFNSEILNRGHVRRLTNLDYGVSDYLRLGKRRSVDRVTWLNGEFSQLIESSSGSSEVRRILREVRRVLSRDGVFVLLVEEYPTSALGDQQYPALSNREQAIRHVTKAGLHFESAVDVSGVTEAPSDKLVLLRFLRVKPS